MNQKLALFLHLRKMRHCCSAAARRCAASCHNFCNQEKSRIFFFFSLLDHEKNHLQAYLLCVQNLFPPLCWYIWHILHVLQDYYPRFNTYLSLFLIFSEIASHTQHFLSTPIFGQRASQNASLIWKCTFVRQQNSRLLTMSQ